MSRSLDPDDEVIAAALRRRASRTPVGRPWVESELLQSVSAGMAPRAQTARASRVPAFAALAAVIAVFAVLVVGLLPQGSYPGGPYDEAQSGDFVLTLTAAEPVYAPGEPIDVEAQLVYEGPQDVVQLSGTDSLINGFSARQLDGPLAMGPGWDLPCVAHQLTRTEALSVAYQKSGAWDPGAPHADFYSSWIRDPVFWLPAGRWEIRAYADFFDGPECSGDRVQMQVSIVLVIRDPAAEPSTTGEATEIPVSTSLPQVSPPPTWTPAPSPATPPPVPTPGEGDAALVRAHWQLAPSERPTHESTSLRLVVTDPACSAGGSPDEQIEGPQIDYQAESVTITFLLELDTSDATCAEFGGTDITVELAEPLGDRVLVDGGAGVTRVLEHGPDLLVVVGDEPLSPAMMRFLHLISPETCITGREYDREGPDIEALTRMAEELEGEDGLIDDGRAWLGEWRDAILEFGGLEAYVDRRAPRFFIGRADGQTWLDFELPPGETFVSNLSAVEIGGGRTVWYPGYSSAWWPDRDEDC